MATIAEILPESYECAMLLARLINQRVVSLGLKSKKYPIENWAIEIDRLHRIDGAPFAQIRDVIRWCQSDPFWRMNILSGGKLRKQYIRLLMQMQAESDGDNPTMEIPRFS